MGSLTTHVLDTAQGCPAAKVGVTLYRVDGGRQLLKQDRTNTDGRLDSPILDADDFQPVDIIRFAVKIPVRRIRVTAPGRGIQRFCQQSIK